VCITHRNVARLMIDTDYVELGPDSVLLQFAPLAFDASTLEIWGALLNGARLVVHPRHVPTAAELARTLVQQRVNTLWLTAGFFHHMVEQELQALATVRQVLAGGDVLSVAHVQRLLDAKAEIARRGGDGGVVINGYGPTENTTFTCCHRMAPGEQLTGTVPIGRPIANTTVYLLDEHRQPVPVGVPGELFTGGDGVGRGYLAMPDATAAKFVPDPFSSRADATMYRTGDQARWRADGSIEFLGRRDRQVKVRGFRIELEDIEDALRRVAPVRDAAVIARRDASGANALVGYLVPRDDTPTDPAAIKLALAECLPAYMVPGLFVDLPALPLTANGKLDRAALPEATESPAPRQVVDPRTRVEAQLHAIWERVLGHSGFGVTDNFFDLGGHSLLAVRLFAQIEKVFGMRLPVSALFSAPDIAQLARRIEHEGFSSPWSSLVAIQPEGRNRPLFMVPGIGGNVVCYGELARHLGPEQPLYGLQARGLDEREEPFERIEPMAAHYLEEVRRVRPEGPYRLGGTCFGGVVALEMARQLRRQGQQVEMLFLLETWPPPPRLPLLDALRTRSHQLRFLVQATQRNLMQIWKLPLRQWPGALRSRLAIVGDIAAKRDVYRGDRAAMYVDRVSIANQRALAHYKPRPYDGALRCAMATGRRFRGPDSRLLWNKLAPHDYAQLELPATDSGMLLLPPHVEPLARWMNQQLQQAADRTRAPASATPSAAAPQAAAAH
jgi:aspartate racemase